MGDKKPEIKDDQEYQVAQAMAFLGVKQRLTIWKWARDGRLPSHEKPALPKPWLMFWGRDLKKAKRLMVKNPKNGSSYLPSLEKKRGPKPRPAKKSDPNK